MQKSCELAARYAELDKQKIQLDLDLELARTELQKVREGAAGKATLSTDFVFRLEHSFAVSDSITISL